MVSIASALAFVLCWQVAVAGDEETRWCYECGTGVEGKPGCVEFVRAGTWSPFWRKCSGDSVCVKTVPGWNTSDESRAVRSCTPMRNLRGIVHQDGCWAYSGSSMLTCYCSTDLCNAALTLTPPALLLLAALLMVRAGG